MPFCLHQVPIILGIIQSVPFKQVYSPKPNFEINSVSLVSLVEDRVADNRR